MKEGFTSINVILDRSGSMANTVNDTIGGFNNFLREQQKVPGEAIFTLALFDHEYELMYDGVPLSEVKELNTSTYVPRGWTALLDAVGRTIKATEAKINSMKEEDRPSKVIFVILTDGNENNSRTYKHAKIMEMVKHQTDEAKWQFIFLGANIDAFAVGNSIGATYGGNMSYNYSMDRIPGVFCSLSDSMTTSRTTGAILSLNQDDLIDQAASQSTAGDSSNNGTT